jgi:exopolyphosphatase/pppGpp-phosphohydrolase
MKVLTTAVMTAALLGMLAAPAPIFAEEECDNVTEALEESVAISLKNFESTMADLKKTMSEPADEQKKATVKNTFCSSSGEFLGVSRAARAVAQICAPKQRSALAAFDKSIKEMETAIDNTCK